MVWPPGPCHCGNVSGDSVWTAWVGTENFGRPKLWASNSWALGNIVCSFKGGQREARKRKKPNRKPMFGGCQIGGYCYYRHQQNWHAIFPNASACACLSVAVLCARWSHTLIICHSTPPEPNLTNRGDIWGTRGMPPDSVYQPCVWVMPTMMILWCQRPLAIQRGLTVKSASVIYQYIYVCFNLIILL